MAMEIGTSVAGSVAGSAGKSVMGPLFDAAGNQLGYLYHYDDNIEALNKQAKKLAAMRDSLQGHIEVAERNLEIIETNVRNWMVEVDKITAEAEKFLEDEANASKKCLYGWCIDLKQRYKFSKEAKLKTLVISELQEEGNFARLSHPAPPRGIISASVGSSGTFESRESTKKQIMAALNEDNVSIVGVCGMGGVGKTTLVKQIGKQVKDSKLYEAAVIAVASQTPNIKNIQGEIANMLGLKSFPDISESARASSLWDRIMKEKRVLIILDNVWGRIKLDDIGIPFGKDHEGCKIVLTSRSITVCNQMGCQKIFKVETLSKQESWVLFKQVAGPDVENSEITSIAREVAARCGGLPIAIVTIAGALKDKDRYVWMDAALQLKDSSPADIEGMQGNVVSSLELSYNYLKSEAEKSVFLFCSLFPEDFNIPVEDLVGYGLGLRWFRNLETVKHVRVRTRAVVSTLISSFLLTRSDEEYYEDCVKMHDVVRDVALTIAPKYNHKFMVKAGIGLQEWPNCSDTFEDLTAISLLSNNMHELPDGLGCPKLQALLLQRNYYLKVVPNTFFQGMKDLKVLDLSELTQLYSLPESLSLLENLRTLHLCYSRFHDFSVIGMLRNL